MNKLLLLYLRRFPIDFGKNRLAKCIKLPKTEHWVQFKNSMGIIFDLNLSEYQMKQIYLFDLYEKNTIYQLNKIISTFQKKDITVADVGANIGFYSLTFAALLENKNYQIHAFEPNPYTFTLLENNLAKNSKNNIKANNFGLSNETSSFELTYNEGNLGTASFFAKGRSGNNKTTTVDCITFDDYCMQNGIKEVDIIKVDIEGAEYNFFKGAKTVISQSKRCIIIAEIIEENCQRAGYSSNELFNYISGLGFKAYMPKAFPFSLRKIEAVPEDYCDNIIFIKG